MTRCKRIRQLRCSVGILIEDEFDLAGQQVCCFRKLL